MLLYLTFNFQPAADFNPRRQIHHRSSHKQTVDFLISQTFALATRFREMWKMTRDVIDLSGANQLLSQIFRAARPVLNPQSACMIDYVSRAGGPWTGIRQLFEVPGTNRWQT